MGNHSGFYIPWIQGSRIVDVDVQDSEDVGFPNK